MTVLCLGRRWCCRHVNSRFEWGRFVVWRGSAEAIRNEEEEEGFCQDFDCRRKSNSHLDMSIELFT
jgi:hypothetical protein